MKIARNFMVSTENIDWLKQFNSMSDKVDSLISAARNGTAKSDLDNWLALEEKTKKEKAALEKAAALEQRQLHELKAQEDQLTAWDKMTAKEREIFLKKRKEKWDKLIKVD
jgi:hypothetical protein